MEPRHTLCGVTRGEHPLGFKQVKQLLIAVHPLRIAWIRG